MPYSAEHKGRSRERILASALRLFSERGFAQVTIDDVMADAGLTRGAFYAHFGSKENLYAESIRHGIETSAITAIAGGPPGLKTLQRMVDGYLTRAHVEGEMAPCPLAFFSTDVGVREDRVRDTYTQAFRSLANTLGGHANGKISEEQVFAMAVLMVGGVAISTALTDSATKDRILSGCRRVIMTMADGGELSPPARPSRAARKRRRRVSTAQPLVPKSSARRRPRGSV